MDKYNESIKESFKSYFKKLNYKKIVAYKVSYKFYDLVTAEFKCKIL
jgi:hypothetical protein